MSSQDYVLPAAAGIGHVHLKVSHLEVAIGFYRDVLGFELTTRFGDEAAFLSAGGYHHHLALNTWESRGGSRPPRDATGLYHFAVRFPDRRTLAIAVRRVLDAGVRLHGAADHGVSQSIYLADPDGNGVELTIDTPRETWRYHPDGDLVMVTDPLDLRLLLEEAVLPADTTPA
jgi:catechol 2,3-dioxygenase